MSQNQADTWGCVFLCLIGVVVIGSTFMLGFTVGQDYAQNRAIEYGVGRWVINPQSGRKSFEYGASPAK